VLGESNKNSADPEEKAYKVLRRDRVQVHPIAHHHGFIEDIEDFPIIRLQSAVLWRYYRPEYTTIVLVGD